jgi:hypothetical protein
VCLPPLLLLLPRVEAGVDEGAGKSLYWRMIFIGVSVVVSVLERGCVGCLCSLVVLDRVMPIEVSSLDGDG